MHPSRHGPPFLRITVRFVAQSCAKAFHSQGTEWLLITVTRVASLLVLASLAIPPRAFASAYTFTVLNAPGAFSTGASGINNAGQIVGSFGEFPGPSSHGFEWDGTTYTTIDDPAATGTQANGINDAGQIVGSFYDGTTTHAFVKDGASYTAFDGPGARFLTVANGINNAGQIVGGFDSTTFLKDGSTYTTLAVPGAYSTSSSAIGINNAGEIVGNFADNSVTHAIHGFLKNGAVYTTLDPAGTIQTHATGINAFGQIVGYYFDGTNSHGFVTDGTTYATFDIPGAVSIETGSINDAGQIVGDFIDGSGAHGFLATPVPEPSTALLASVGVVAFAARRRHPRGASLGESASVLSGGALR